MRKDAFGFLLTYLIVLVGVPANLVIQPLGAQGTPAGVIAAGAFLWWVLGRIAYPSGTAWAWQPTRYAISAFALAVVASYVGAALTGLPVHQMSGADRALIALIGWVGVAFVASDMLTSVASVNRLLRAITVAAAVLAVLGMMQFFLGIDLAGMIHIPGLSANQTLEFVGKRSEFRRVSGTASHPIEFGVVLAMVFPLALHFGITDVGRPAWKRWGVVATIGMALPMSVSRSAIVGLLTGLLVLFFSWRGMRRTMLLLLTPVILVVMRFLIPGLLGTLLGLFEGFGSDPSIAGRTDDYAVVGAFISQSPFIGRGFGTFLPEDFIVLDNQYLGSMVETGALGVVTLLLVFVIGFGCARGIKIRGATSEMRDLGIALSACISVVMVGYVTFDGLAFPMVTGLLFLLLGCIGALWRLVGGRAYGAVPDEEIPLEVPVVTAAGARTPTPNPVA